MKHLAVLVLILSSTIANSQICNRDSIISDFLKGKLLLINQLSVVNTNDAFFSKLLSLDFKNCEIFSPEEGEVLYGTLGELGVISITLTDIEPLRHEYVDIVDANVLKYFNIENPVFYHTDGIPSHDMYMALNTLINKKIEKVDIIEKSEARAIWGEPAKNGAIMITCNKTQALTLFSQ
jgi:hypothetical protein